MVKGVNLSKTSNVITLLSRFYNIFIHLQGELQHVKK